MSLPNPYLIFVHAPSPQTWDFVRRLEFFELVLERYIFIQVASGGSRRSFQVGFVSREKGEYIPPDVNDPRFKDDKFKDDPDVRGILGNIKHDFDQEEKGIYHTPEPKDDSQNRDEDSIPTKDKKNEEKSLDDNTKKEEEGKLAGGAKNMKELLEKIYGARTKAAAETSVGKDYNQTTCCLIQVYTFILHQS